MPLAFDQYQQQKNHALNAAQKVIETTKELNIPSIKSLKSELKEATDLSSAILVLQKIHDKRNNINWHIKGNSLVRDARDAIDPPKPTIEAYILQYLNHVRGAILLLNDPKLIAELKESSLKKIEQLVEITEIKEMQARIKYENTELALKLLKNKVKNADSKIRLAKEFANFEDSHFDIVTISRSENITIIEAEIRQTALTNSQRKMFEEIDRFVSTDPKKPMKIKLLNENMDWFNNLERWQQDLVKKFSKVIAEGNHIIPNQLRNILPLLRNSYGKVTAIKNEDEKLEEILETKHSGSISTNTKGNNVTIAIENIRQLRQFCPKASALHLNALLSPVNFFDVDSKDDSIIRKATSNMVGAIKTTLPFNFLRKFFGGGVDLEGSVKILQEIAKSYKDELPNFSKFLTTLDPELMGNAVEEIEKIKDINKMEALNNAFELAKDMILLKKINIFSSDIENTNSRMSINLKLLSYAARKGYLGEDLTSIPVVNTYCKSGKDRTGIIEIGATLKAVEQKLKIEDPLKFALMVKDVLKAQHGSTMAGMQGGSIGCYGIKSNAALNASETIFKEVISYISPKSASYNRFKVSSKVKKEEFRIEVKKINKKLQSYIQEMYNTKDEPSTGKIETAALISKRKTNQR